jgi:hypothetical protein
MNVSYIVDYCVRRFVAMIHSMKRDSGNRGPRNGSTSLAS